MTQEFNCKILEYDLFQQYRVIRKESRICLIGPSTHHVQRAIVCSFTEADQITFPETLLGFALYDLE